MSGNCNHSEHHSSMVYILLHLFSTLATYVDFSDTTSHPGKVLTGHSGCLADVGYLILANYYP